jgi:hypothetical protein
MARQISGSNESPDFDVGAWVAKWLRERERYRSFLLVTATEPLREDEWISVEVFPHMDTRDFEGAFLDREYSKTGYEVPSCLLNEQLTQHTARRLTTVLSIIRELHGLDFRQGLAFLVQRIIFVIDFSRAQSGKESMLFGPTWGQFDLDTQVGRDPRHSLYESTLMEAGTTLRIMGRSRLASYFGRT